MRKLKKPHSSSGKMHAQKRHEKILRFLPRLLLRLKTKTPLISKRFPWHKTNMQKMEKVATSINDQFSIATTEITTHTEKWENMAHSEEVI